MSYKFNNLFSDDFGRFSGVVAVNKPIGITSHDAVDVLRREFKTKQVGHAGALDPFASGVLVLLVGKATKYSELFLNSDKDYLATVLFGRATNSADPEGQVLQDIDTASLDLAKLQSELEIIKPQFMPDYRQFVPVYSSIKVGGEKLRVLARSSDRFELITTEGNRIAKFYKGDQVIEVQVPAHDCKITKMDFQSAEYITFADKSYASVVVDVACSKGTYIRSLAEDIGLALPTALPAMLSNLCRTRVADIHLVDCVGLDNVRSLIS